MIKRIFSDMDGTLLDNTGAVSEENVSLLKSAGIPMTLVSARAPMEMMAAIKKLDLTGAQVSFNGGLIYRVEGGRILPIHSQPIAKGDVHTLLGAIHEKFPEVSLSYYDLHKWYCHEIDKGILFEQKLTQQKPTRTMLLSHFLKPKKEIYKLMMIVFDEKALTNLQEFVLSLGIDTVAVQQSGNHYLEITHAAAKKSAGIDYIMQKEALSEGETAVFGDGHNDLPMFERTSFPIAMANASPDVIAQAKFITLVNQCNGVGYGIHKFLRNV